MIGGCFLDVHSINFVGDGDEPFFREFFHDILFVLLWLLVLAFQQLGILHQRVV